MPGCASRFPSEGYPTASADSIMELSRKFGQASLQSSGRNLSYDAPPSKVPDANSTRLFNRKISPTNNSYFARQQRPIIAHRQCKSAQFSKIHALVEDIIMDHQICVGTSHSPSQTCDSFLHLPIQQAVPSIPSPSISFSTSTSSSETDETDSYRGSKRQCGDRTRSDPRPPSMEPVTRQNVVLRSIRVRRSFHKRRSLESGKRCDR